MLQMGYEVEGIVDGDAHDDAGDADDDDADAVVDDSQCAHGKEPAPGDAKHDEQQGPRPAEDNKQQDDDKHYGQGDGQEAVGLNLTGITHSDDWSSEEAHVHLWEGLHGAVGSMLQEVSEFGVMLRLASSIG